MIQYTYSFVTFFHVNMFLVHENFITGDNYFKVNLALGKETWDSTPDSNKSRAIMAVNGNKNNTTRSQCSRTSKESWPPWRVDLGDLGDIYHVAYVNITTRKGLLIMAKFKVYLSQRNR